MVQQRRVKKSLYFIIRQHGFDNDFVDTDLPDAVASMEEAFRDDRYRALYDIGFTAPADWYSPSMLFLHRVASSFLMNLSTTPDIETLRHRVEPSESGIPQILGSVPFIQGSEFVDRNWITDMWSLFLSFFREEIMAFNGTVGMYFTERNSRLRTPERIFFHLVEDDKDPEYPFAFLATYSTENEKGKVSHLPLRYALEQYRGDNKKILSLLAPLSKVSENSQLIAGFMDSGELFHLIGLTKDEAFAFLREVPFYESSGILCRIPDWWKRRGNQSVEIVIEASDGFLGASSLLSCVPAITIDGMALTADEIRDILSMTEGLANIKGRWIEVNHAKLRELLEQYERLAELYGDGITISQALRLSGGLSNDDDGESVQISNENWLSTLMDNIGRSGDAKFELPRSFVGELRPYQLRGAQWLTTLSAMGFGSCLADDMGLGKTVQVLAYLESRRLRGERSLLVVPASLIGNWEKEASRFTPQLDIYVAHGGNITPGIASLTITTYGMVNSRQCFGDIEWDNVILDEAQAIKNPSSKQSQAVKALVSKHRIALTGTPVENKLTDLWSLFEFTNPGLLGTRSEFSEFVKYMESRHGYSKLRDMTSPFILRRLKTDKTIIDELPDKIEKKEYVSLSKKQSVLYRKLLDELAEALEKSSKKSRLGLVLKMITSFKQVCNHPDQYLGQKEYSEADSGKMELLRQICETILEKREKVLVFTQYKEMTAPLCDLLTDVFGRKGLVIHGDVSPKERTALVDRFNDGSEYIPFMVLTVKAGGVGLNLTSANHVIHFDRWWNPAVENQATDRAFRIGQKRNVIVHKFICKGTMEEKIDLLIESKMELASNVIGAGESWISEMDNKQLLDLFRLD